MKSLTESSKLVGYPASVRQSARIRLEIRSLSTRTPSLSKMTRS